MPAAASAAIKQPNLVCIICNKPGGLLKGDSTYSKGNVTYFHVFCIITSSYAFFKNISTLKQIDFDLTSVEGATGELPCAYCPRSEPAADGVIETCSDCNSTKFHMLCAWLAGCTLTFEKT